DRVYRRQSARREVLGPRLPDQLAAGYLASIPSVPEILRLGHENVVDAFRPDEIRAGVEKRPHRPIIGVAVGGGLTAYFAVRLSSGDVWDHFRAEGSGPRRAGEIERYRVAERRLEACAGFAGCAVAGKADGRGLEGLELALLLGVDVEIIRICP